MDEKQKAETVKRLAGNCADALTAELRRLREEYEIMRRDAEASRQKKA